MITKVKRPNDKIISGAEINFRIGFKIALKSARIRPAKSKNFQSFEKENPLTKKAAKDIANELPKILTIKRSIFSKYAQYKNTWNLS